MTTISLRDLIASQRAAILGRFVERVMRDEVAPVPTETRRSELIDHLPAFLDVLVESLEGDWDRDLDADDAIERREQRISSAARHGLQRLRLGFDVEAVVREYGILRDCILAVVLEQSSAISVKEFAVLSKCLDVGTVNAVKEYSHHKHADLERALRAREEVLAVVSHDLRTPLNAIVMSTHVLASRLPAEGRDYEVTAAIQRAADQMTRLIRDLLDLASLDAGQLSLEVAAEDVSALLKEAVAAFEGTAEARAIAIRTEPAPGTHVVSCDRSSVHRVLANLLENALKFTPAGGEIVVGAEVAAAHARFYVKDSGSGIPSELVARVFERFVRSADPARRGTGLGLYIARGLVEASGGQIGVESTEGAGSTFWFTLPLVP